MLIKLSLKLYTLLYNRKIKQSTTLRKSYKFYQTPAVLSQNEWFNNVLCCYNPCKSTKLAISSQFHCIANIAMSFSPIFNIFFY